MKSVSNKKHNTLTACIAIGLVAGGVLSASAQSQQDRSANRSAIGQQEQSGQPGQELGADRQQPGQQQRQQPAQRLGANQDQSNQKHSSQRMGAQSDAQQNQLKPLVRASEILDMEVQGHDGQKLGDVEEIILSQDRRSVEHISVSLDNDDSVKLSLKEFSAKQGDDNVLVVRASKQELQQRQTQDRDQPRAGRQQADQESHRVSKLIGLDLKGTDGNEVGSINDLIIDTQSSQIKTAAVSTGGILGMGQNLSSVEWQQVTFAADGNTASIKMTEDQLSQGAQSQDEYWERHALEVNRSDRQQGLQSSQRTPSVDQPRAARQIQGQDRDQQSRDLGAQSGQRPPVSGIDGRQSPDQQLSGQRTPSAAQPRAAGQSQGQDDTSSLDN